MSEIYIHTFTTKEFEKIFQHIKRVEKQMQTKKRRNQIRRRQKRAAFRRRKRGLA
jgi:hypothetical protein